MCPDTHDMDASPTGTSLGDILESSPASPWVASEKRENQRKGKIKEKRKSKKGLGGLELSQFGMSSGLFLVHLHPALEVEPGGTSKTPASVRDRLSPTREGKLQWRVCLHTHLEQGRTILAETHGFGCLFFLSYSWKLAVPEPLL